MRLFISFLFLSAVTLSCKEQADSKNSDNSEKSVKENSYDSLLAVKYGADQYGMKPYVMAFLKKGPNRDLDSLEAEKLQRAHLDNIFKLADEGKLVVAGPFMDDTDIRGIYIFNVATVEEAKKLTETDPAIKKGSLVMELHPWYGPAGLVGLKEIQKKITNEKI